MPAPSRTGRAQAYAVAGANGNVLGEGVSKSSTSPDLHTALEVTEINSKGPKTSRQS